MSTKMTELLTKWRIDILNVILLRELMALNCSEITTQKNTFRTEERTECAWYIIENNSKIGDNYFYKNFYSKNCRMLPNFNTLFGYFWKYI